MYVYEKEIDGFDSIYLVVYACFQSFMSAIYFVSMVKSIALAV